MWCWGEMDAGWWKKWRGPVTMYIIILLLFFNISNFQKMGEWFPCVKWLTLVFKDITYWKSCSAGTWRIAYWNITNSISLLTVYSVQLILFIYFLPINNIQKNKTLGFSIFPLMKSSKNQCSSSKEPVLVITTWMLHCTLH